MYPFKPNLDNYYVDDINSSKNSPMIIESPELYNEYFTSDNFLENEFKIFMHNIDYYNILYLVIVVLLWYIIIIKK